MKPLRRLCQRHRFALGIAALLFLTAPVGFADRALHAGDEARDAAIAKEMATAGDYFHPRLAGRPVPEKPFFFYAAVASSYRMSKQVTPASTRLPSVLFSALTLLAGAASAWLLFSPRAGLLTAGVLATTYLFVVNAHDCVVDVGLTAFVAAGLLAFLAGSRAAGHSRWGLAFGMAASGALLVKGLIGPVLLVLLTVPFLWEEHHRPSGAPGKRVSAAAWAVPAGTLMFWMGTIYGWGGWSALRQFVWTEQFGRFLGLAGKEFSHHQAPFYFYLAHLPAILFPWSITLPAAIWAGWKLRTPSGQASPRRTLSLVLALATLFLSVAGTKRTVYFLPVVPIAAMIVASYLDERVARPAGRIGVSLWVQAAAIAVGASIVPLVPALEDRHVSLPEAAVVASVALLAGTLFLTCGSSAGRLMAASFVLAVGSLVLFDRYALPRLDPDRGGREFFARVQRHLAPGRGLYSYRLNEDVLGRACLELRPAPVAEDDTARLRTELKLSPGFVLADERKVDRLGAARDLSLSPVETGRIGGRHVALYESGNRVARLDP